MHRCPGVGALLHRQSGSHFLNPPRGPETLGVGGRVRRSLRMRDSRRVGSPMLERCERPLVRQTGRYAGRRAHRSYILRTGLLRPFAERQNGRPIRLLLERSKGELVMPLSKCNSESINPANRGGLP